MHGLDPLQPRDEAGRLVSSKVSSSCCSQCRPFPSLCCSFEPSCRRAAFPSARRRRLPPSLLFCQAALPAAVDLPPLFFPSPKQLAASFIGDRGRRVAGRHEPGLLLFTPKSVIVSIPLFRPRGEAAAQWGCALREAWRLLRPHPGLAQLRRALVPQSPPPSFLCPLECPFLHDEALSAARADTPRHARPHLPPAAPPPSIAAPSTEGARFPALHARGPAHGRARPLLTDGGGEDAD